MELANERRLFKEKLETVFPDKPKKVRQIMLIFDLSTMLHRQDRFCHPHKAALIILNELKWRDKNAIMTMLLHDAPEEKGFFGDLANYENFLLEARFRLKKLANETVANWVIDLTKPLANGDKFKSKADVTDFKFKKIGSSLEILVLKMTDRLQKLRDCVSFECGEVSTQEKERVWTKTKETYLPFFEKTLARFKAETSLKPELIESGEYLLDRIKSILEQ